MKLTNRGIVFECYRNASPSREYCSFTDTDGATLIIKTSTLVRMFELVKFDLERNGARVNSSCLQHIESQNDK